MGAFSSERFHSVTAGTLLSCVPAGTFGDWHRGVENLGEADLFEDCSGGNIVRFYQLKKCSRGNMARAESLLLVAHCPATRPEAYLGNKYLD